MFHFLCEGPACGIPEANTVQADATLEHFETLKAAHRDVAGRTRALADGCGRLVAEEEALAEFAGAPALSSSRRQLFVGKTVCMFIDTIIGSARGMGQCSHRPDRLSGRLFYLCLLDRSAAPGSKCEPGPGRAGALAAKLAYFDELERIAAHFHTAALSPDADRLLPLLQRLDECLTCALPHTLESFTKGCC